MSGISHYIREEVFVARLQRHAVLVVYDDEGRYRELCAGLKSETVGVVDASESSIEARDAASRAFTLLGAQRAEPSQLLIYVPAKAPVSDEERQQDPFSAYAACGAIFPSGDGDDYLSLCLKAKPDHATEIRQLFEQQEPPSFALIDNIGGGRKWPTLRTLLKADSAREILLALAAPTDRQKAELQASDTWVSETRELFASTLGLKLITRGKTWSSIAEEFWRFLLFSEFVFDLPGALPPDLANVPAATAAAQQLVEALCDALRSDPRTRTIYVERAGGIENEFELPHHCRGIADLGIRDTFQFEERTVLERALTALQSDELDKIRAIIERQRFSVWIESGESQAQWGLVEAALRLVESCDDCERQLGSRVSNLDSLIDWYVVGLREVDTRQREFETAVIDNVSVDDAMADVVEHARARYGRLIAKVSPLFTRHLETAGWPPAGRLANADVFDKFVGQPLKESGKRVALILVDALRYELGVALHDQLAEGDQVELTAACAQLPTVTPVGMASLLPGAGTGLQVLKDGSGFVVALDGTRLPQVAQRMELLRARYGDRFAEVQLSKFVSQKSKVGDTVELLVVRSGEIDSHLENNPETTLSLIHQTLKHIRVAVHKLKQLEFDEVVIATDHGFFLNAHSEAGDLCAKPPGNWVVVHDRSLLGEGAADSTSFVVAAGSVGIRGDFQHFAGPRTMAPYRRGLLYFHGGASLQEAIVPVLQVHIAKSRQPEITRASVTLHYRNGAKRITTRLPVVEISADAADIFAVGADIELLLEARDRKGNVVGEAKAGGVVNAATGTISLRPGARQQVTVRMDPDYEGKFTLEALNPTTLAVYSALELETDYAV